MADLAIITLVETDEGTILIQTKFDPPMSPDREDSPLADAACVAIGAVSNWAAGLPHDETED